MVGKCLNCDVEFDYQPSQSTGKYCSNKCQGEHQIKQRFTIGTDYKYRMGLYLKEIRGNRCEECGIDEWLGKPLTLQVDHINGDRRDNRYKNLKILCPNCHTQCKTWGVGNVTIEGKARMIEGGKKGAEVKHKNRNK